MGEENFNAPVNMLQPQMLAVITAKGGDDPVFRYGADEPSSPGR